MGMLVGLFSLRFVQLLLLPAQSVNTVVDKLLLELSCHAVALPLHDVLSRFLVVNLEQLAQGWVH